MPSLLQRFWVLPVIFLASFPACSSMPAKHSSSLCTPSFTPLFIRTCPMEGLMLYYDRVRKQPAADVVKEYEKAKKELAQNPSSLNRAKIALLLALPNTSFHDTAAALNLLNQLSKETDEDMAPGLRGFADFLSVMLNEQQRILRNANDLTHNANDLTQKLKDEQKRTRAWQEKVNAIKMMEKNLIRRDKQ